MVMMKKVIVAGLLGALVLIVWTFVVNGILGFKAGIDMKQVPNEREVYEVLKENVTEPGRYVCNPEVTSERRFPDGEPVFGILYGGMGHEGAGGMMWFGLVIYILSPIIAAWMLSQASALVLSSYLRKVLFFSAIGLLFALFGDLANAGIGSYPVRDAVIWALHDIILWTIIGLAVSGMMRPEAPQTA
jgi:hypothetical protein